METLQFTKITRDTTIDVRVRVDRAIAEHEADKRSARCHLLSIFGNDQEVAAIAAALSEEARFYLTWPQIDRLMISVVLFATGLGPTDSWTSHEELFSNPLPIINEVRVRVADAAASVWSGPHF